MFKSAVIRLTIGYVGAIALICLMFSIPVYSVVSGRLRSGAERQAEFIGRAYRQGIPQQNLSDLVRSREQQLKADRRQLLSGLVIINMCIILAGGYLSYLFARQTLKPIQEAHDLQKQFTANASHEFRTPLAVMQAESEVALRNKQLSLTQAKEIISSNLEEVSRLQNITSQLLNLSKIQPTFKKVDLVKLVTAEVKLHQKASSVNISLESPKSLVAEVDLTLMRQVVGILLDNAIKYTIRPQQPSILVKIKQTRQAIILTIRDNAAGIAAVDRSKIFDRFYRGKTTDQDGQSVSGNGLGLSIAKQIIEQHGGEISLVKSVVGKGSTFAVKLVPPKK